MEPNAEKPNPDAPSDQNATDQTAPNQTAPADALGKTNEQIKEEQAANGVDGADDLGPGEDTADEPQVGPLKRFFRKANIYLLIFLLLVVIAAAITTVSYLNSKKAPVVPGIATQELTQDALKQLANSDATIGNSAQTLSIQGNATFSGQVLARSDLNVAGNIQLGGNLLAPNLTVSGTSNLNDTQISSLQVATNALVQGTTTLKDLNVSGTAAFNGPVTASQITVTKLILSGNASLQIPNHIAFTGPTPSRSTDQAALGSSGTASISGSDTTGSVSINTGGNPAAGCFIKLTFAQAFSNPPHVMIGPIGAAAGQTNYYVTRSSTGFSICTTNAAPANQVFGFDYFVTN